MASITITNPMINHWNHLCYQLLILSFSLPHMVNRNIVFNDKFTLVSARLERTGQSSFKVHVSVYAQALEYFREPQWVAVSKVE